MSQAPGRVPSKYLLKGWMRSPALGDDDIVFNLKIWFFFEFLTARDHTTHFSRSMLPTTTMTCIGSMSGWGTCREPPKHQVQVEYHNSRWTLLSQRSVAATSFFQKYCRKSVKIVQNPTLPPQATMCHFRPLSAWHWWTSCSQKECVSYATKVGYWYLGHVMPTDLQSFSILENPSHAQHIPI